MSSDANIHSLGAALMAEWDHTSYGEAWGNIIAEPETQKHARFIHLAQRALDHQRKHPIPDEISTASLAMLEAIEFIGTVVANTVRRKSVRDAGRIDALLMPLRHIAALHRRDEPPL